MAILRGIKLCTALAALALFFMPWLDIQCSGKSIATQTGFQTITGDATPSEEMRADQAQGGKRNEPLGTATMVAAALIATIIAIMLLASAVLKGSYALDRAGSAICAIALLLLIVQAMLGLPAKDELVAAISTDQATNEVDMASALATQVMANLKVDILPAFYFTCVLLGIPVLLLLYQLVDRLRD